MEDAFIYVLVGVVVLSTIAAILSLRGDRYEHIGRGGLFEDDPKRRGGGGGSAPMTQAQIDAEVRGLLEQRNQRRIAKGQDPLDVEAELRRLAGPATGVDPEVEAEVRRLVESKNARLVRRGKPPLDVEAEVRRQLDDLMG